MRREWIEMVFPCVVKVACWSPSMRREWIEIHCINQIPVCTFVSLHAEGVD